MVVIKGMMVLQYVVKNLSADMEGEGKNDTQADNLVFKSHDAWRVHIQIHMHVQVHVHVCMQMYSGTHRFAD